MTQTAYAIQAIQALIQDAIERESSDILISLKADSPEIRYVINGCSTLQSRYANNDNQAFADAYNCFLEGPGRNDLSQCADGQVKMQLPSGLVVKLRIARWPCLPDGYQFAVKLLIFSKDKRIEDIGYTAHHFDTISRAVDEALKNDQGAPSTAEIAGPVGRL